MRAVAGALLLIGLLVGVEGCSYVKAGVDIAGGFQEVRHESQRRKEEKEDRQRRLAQEEADRLERERQAAQVIAAEQEDRRDKSLPSDRLTSLANGLAAAIIESLPQEARVREYISKKQEKLVIAIGSVENGTDGRTPNARVDDLLKALVRRLDDSREFSAQFEVVADRDQAQRILKKTEGSTDDLVIEGEGSGKAGRYAPDKIWSVSVKLTDTNQFGKTSWRATATVMHLSSRSVLIRDAGAD